MPYDICIILKGGVFMPLLSLGIVVTVLVALYMLVLANKDRFVKKNEPIRGPADVIYLPAAQGAGKK